jgi:YVTN family beta-propeller protein
MFLSEPMRSQTMASKRLALLGSVSLSALIMLGSNAAWAQSGPFVYVPYPAANNVSVIDTSTNTVVSTFGVGSGAWAAAVRGDESLVYVSNSNDNTVSVINTATNAIIATVSVGSDPHGLAISPDGTSVYVVNQDSNSVSVINTATNTVTATITVGQVPGSVALSPDGTRAYVVNTSSNTVSVINTVTDTVVARINVESDPGRPAVSPDGSSVYVTNKDSNTVSVINTATNTVVTTINVGTTPSGIAFSPDGTHVYVANNASNTVSVINTATNTVVTTINVGTAPNSVQVSPSGASVYVTNTGSNTVSVINAATNTIIATPSAGSAVLGGSGICSNGNALLDAGLTFKANTSGAIACTLASGPTGAPGPIFTGGTLQLAGGSMAINLPVNVQSAGGTIDTLGNTVTLANTLSGPGPLAVKGNLVFTAAAMWMLSINGAQSSTITVTGGSAALGGASVSIANGSTVVGGNKYTILTASGAVTGSFNPTITYNGEIGTLTYDAHDVFLSFSTNPVSPTVTPPPGLPINLVGVASAINNFSGGGGTLPISLQNLSNLSPSQLVTALTQLDGEASTDAEKGTLTLTSHFLGLMLDPFVEGRSGPNGGPIGFTSDEKESFPPDIALAYASVLKVPPVQSFDQRWTAWGSTFGGLSTTNGNATGGSSNVTTSTYGFGGGMDYHATPSTVYGFGLSGAGTNWSLAQGLGTGHGDAFQAGVYSKTYWGPVYIAAALAYTNNWFSTNRTALNDEITASYTGQSYGGRVEAGYRYAVPLNGTVVGATPYAAIQTQWFHTPTYSETDLAGGGLGLTYSAMTANDTRNEVGVRFDDPTLLSGMPLILRARLAWAHDWVTGTSLDAVFESLPGASFVVNGAAPPANSALVSAGAEYYLSPTWSLDAKFDGEFASGSQTYGGIGTLRYTW